jgi:quinol monooxygenase YgiN
LPNVLVVNRFRVPDDDAQAFRTGLDRALASLAECRGYLDGRIGRNVDDPDLWVLVTTWEGPGAYRRALSSYDVKLHAVPVLGRAVDEPGAYEIVDPDTVLNVASPRSY